MVSIAINRADQLPQDHASLVGASPTGIILSLSPLSGCFIGGTLLVGEQQISPVLIIWFC